MRKLLLFLALSALLASCDGNSPGVPSPLSSPSPSPIAPSAEPALSESAFPPDFPLPSATPYSLYPIGNELSDALNEEHFAVSDDGTAVNYKPWHDFACRVGKNQDASLTVRVFHKEYDALVPETHSKTHVQVARYELSVNNGQASWEDLSDSGNNSSGKPSFTYDEESGKHELLIDGKAVFEFIYFPPDPDKIALYYGYTPLGELPYAYSREDAAADKCLVIVRGVIQNIEVFIDFATVSDPAKWGAFIRIFTEDEKGVTITDVSEMNVRDSRFDERVIVETDFSRLIDSPEESYITDIYDQTIIGIEGGFDSDGPHSLFLNHAGRKPEYIFKDFPSAKP